MDEEGIPGQPITQQPRKSGEDGDDGGENKDAAANGDAGSISSLKKNRGPEPGTMESIGLFELEKTDKIVVQQMETILDEGCCGYEGENEFEISDRFGHTILKAHEQSNCCSRQCCVQSRAFTMELRDRQGSTVAEATRPLRCNNALCCPCLNQTVEVECPPGQPAGSIEQNVYCWRPSYDIKDERGNAAFIIEGPSVCDLQCKRCCCCVPFRRCCCCLCTQPDIEFRILRDGGDRRQVGMISRKWTGTYTGHSSDRFGIDFPDGVGVKMKSVLTVACLLIDYLYFEERSGGGGGGNN